MIAFSPASRIASPPVALTTTRLALADEGKVLSWLFPAVAESVEEAVLNSLCRAETVVGRDGNARHSLPVEEAARLLERHR